MDGRRATLQVLESFDAIPSLYDIIVLFPDVDRVQAPTHPWPTCLAVRCQAGVLREALEAVHAKLSYSNLKLCDWQRGGSIVAPHS